MDAPDYFQLAADLSRKSALHAIQSRNAAEGETCEACAEDGKATPAAMYVESLDQMLCEAHAVDAEAAAIDEACDRD